MVPHQSNTNSSPLAALRVYFALFLLLGLTSCATKNSAPNASSFSPVPAPAPESKALAKTAPAANPAPIARPEPVAPAVPPNSTNPSEVIRNKCIEGRRIICGRVLQLVPGGLVVESGYADLLRKPLTQSWVAPSTVSATRDPNAIESKEPGAICIGVVHLTDLPRRPPVHLYDYVLIQGYPAGQFAYTPVPTITNTVRSFSAGLETAVNLNLRAGGK
jgi:hypothetical protein